MSIVRIRLEPYVFYLFKKRMNKCLKTKHKVDKIEVNSEALCSLANSALNVELVYAILVGINSLNSNKLETENK